MKFPWTKADPEPKPKVVRPMVCQNPSCRDSVMSPMQDAVSVSRNDGEVTETVIGKQYLCLKCDHFSVITNSEAFLRLESRRIIQSQREQNNNSPSPGAQLDDLASQLKVNVGPEG